MIRETLFPAMSSIFEYVYPQKCSPLDASIVEAFVALTSCTKQQHGTPNCSIQMERQRTL
jgi:hypothetical protein